jgi:membrane protein implicated in regulation of membrane protease activity
MEYWALSWWVWVLMGFVLSLIELTTPGGFYFLFFGVAALVVGLLQGIGVIDNPTVQWLLFSIISVVALLLFRKPLLERFHPNVSTDDVDTLIGETALALGDIPARGIGKVELRGTAWNAHNDGDQSLVSGQRCTVERVEGLSLRVRSE